MIKCYCTPISPIFKPGDHHDLNNYRGICVTSCVSKFFRSKRLCNFSQENNLLNPAQIGFKSGNRTADHLFTFKTSIDKHVHQTKRGKVYACFVDFRKAFDSVWRESLFYKLLNNKIDGCFFKLIKNFYSNSK